jgi:hypothetical protein
MTQVGEKVLSKLGYCCPVSVAVAAADGVSASCIVVHIAAVHAHLHEHLDDEKDP